MGKGKCCEYVLWSGILCFKGVYACPAQLVSGIRIGQPEKLGKCLNLKWQAKTSDTLDNFLKMIPPAGMMQTGEIFSKSWYFNICTLQPLDSKERFSKIREYLCKTDAVPVFQGWAEQGILTASDGLRGFCLLDLILALNPEKPFETYVPKNDGTSFLKGGLILNISVVKSGDDIILIMGDTKLTQCLGVNQNSQCLHCVVLSKQSRLLRVKSKPAESPRQTELPLLETRPTSSVLTIDSLKETLNSSHKQSDYLKLANPTNKTDEMVDGHTKCQKGAPEDKRVAESGQAHPERKRHKSEHFPSVVSLDVVTGSCGDTKAHHRKRHKSETPRKNDPNLMSGSGSTFKTPAGKSCLDGGCADKKSENKTFSAGSTKHSEAHGLEKLKTLTDNQYGDSSRDLTTKRSKTTVTKLSILEKKQMESEKVFSQMNMSHSKADVQSLGRIPKKKSTKRNPKELKQTGNEMNMENMKSPKQKSIHKQSSTKTKMNEENMDLDKRKNKEKKGKPSNEAIDKDTPKKVDSTLQTKDQHKKIKIFQKVTQNSKESLSSSKKELSTKETKDLNSKKDILHEDSHSKKERSLSLKKMMSKKENKNSNSKKEVLEEDSYMKQESVSSSRNIRSIKDTQNAHYKDDILDISDKEHKKLPCIDHMTNTKRVDPETDFVTSSHEEDVIHYAHEPELTYERDTTDDLFMLEQSSKGDTDLTGFVNENVSFLESIKHRPVMTPYRDWFPSLEKHEQVKCKEFRDTRGKVTRNTRKTDDDLSVVIPNAKVGLYTHSKTTSMKEFIMHSLHGSLVADSIPRLEVCSLCVAVFESLTSKDLFMYSRKTKVDQSNLSNLKITIQFPQYSDNKRCTVPNDHDSQIDSSRTNKKTRDQNLCKEGQMQSREASEASSLPIKLQNISTVGQCIKSNTIRKEEEENVGAITSEDNQTISKWTDNERKQTRNEKQTDNERKQTRNEKQTDNETKQTRYENLTDNETKQARNEKRTDNATKQTRDEKQTDNETKQTRNEKRTDNATKQAGNEKQTHCESKKGRDKSPDLVWNQSLIEKLRTEGSKSSEKLAQSSTNNRAADTSNNSTLKPNYERQKVSSGCELQSNNVTKLSTDRSQDLVWNRSLITKLRTEGSKSGEKLAQNSSNNRAVNKSMMSLVKPGGKTQDGREKVSSGCELGHGRSITPKKESLTNRLQKITNMPVPKEEKTKSEKSVKNEKRQARQFHPYKKEFKPKQFDTPTWSFDIAYSDMEELLQNLTENMFLLDSRVPADVRRWRKGTSRSSVGRVRGRFCGHRFTRSEVPKCLPSSVESRESDDDYVIDPDLISNMEERARQADMVEEKWQTKTEEETLFIEEMCIYNQDKDEVTSTDSSAHVKTVKSTTTLIVPGMGKTSTYSAEQLGDMDSSTEELFQDNLHREQTPIVHNVSNKEKITTVSGLYSQPVTKSAGNDDSSFKGSSHARNNSNSSKSTTPAKYDNALSKNNAGAKNDHVSTRNTVCTKHDNARSEQDVFAINENATSKNSVCPKDDNGTSENRVCAKSDISLPYSAKNDIAPSKDSECDRYDIASCTNTISKSLYTGPEKGYADISKSDRTLDSLKGNKAKENHGQENIYVQSKLIWNNLTQDKGDGLTSIKAPTLTQRLSDQIKEEKEKVTKEWIEDINEDKPNVNCYATTKCVNETIFEENDSSKGQLQTPQTPGVFCMSGLQDKSILSSDSDVCLDWSDDEILLENGQEESSHDDDDDDKTFIVVDTLVEQDSDPTNIAVLHTRLTNQQLGLTETQLNVKESSLIDNNVKAGSMPITDSMCDVLNSCSEVIEKKKLKAAHQDKSASQDGTLFNVSQEMGIKGLNLQGDADTNYGKTFTAVSKIVSFKESLCEQDNVDKGSSVESVSNNEYAIHQDTDIDRTSVNKTKIDEKNTQKEYNENEQIIKDEHGYIDNLNKIMKLENENVDELYSCKTSTDFENFGQNTQQSAANYTSSSKDITKRENSDFQTNDRDSKSFLTTITAMKKDPDVLSCPDNESITTRTSAWQALPCDTDLNEIRKSQTINTSVSTPFVGEHLDRQAKPHKNLDYTTNHISHTELEEGNKCEKLNETEDRSLVNEIIKIKTNIKTEKESYFDSYSLYTDKAAIITSTNPCTIESSSSKISSFSCTGKPEANKTNAITHTNGSSASKTYSFSSSSKPIAKRTNISPTTQTSTSKTNSISSSSKPIASKPNTISSTTQTSTSKPTTIPCLIELSTNSDTVNKPRSTVGPVKTPQVHPITHQTFVPHQSFHSPPWLSATPQPLLSSQYDMFGSPYQQFNQPYNHLTHNNLLHYPNVTHVSPDMQSLYSNMTQFSPNAQCYYPNMSQISPNSLHSYSNRYDPHMLSYQQGHWNLNEPYHAQRSRSYQTMTSYSPQQSPQNGLNQSNTTNKQWEESLSSNAFRKK